MPSFHVIQNIPSPYRLHLFSEMFRQLREQGGDFHVHFMSDMSRGHSERPLSWRNPTIEFPHTYWNDWGYGHYHFNPSLIAHLLHCKPDYLLVGCPFDTITSLVTAFFCPAKVRCTWSEGNTKTPGCMTGFKGWLKRTVFSKYEYVAVPGQDAVRYIGLHQACTKKHMPVPVLLPNMIDETRFKPRSQWDSGEIETLRQRFGIHSNELFALTPARLDPVKGLLEYVSCLTPEMVKRWKIGIFGQGRLKEDILELANKRGIRDHIFIQDFVPYAEMPKVYAAADLFVLPSRKDPNPLSVVEALNAGLPVAISDQAGNVEEAVGRNGWRLPVLQDEEFGKALENIFFASKECLGEMGLVSQRENARFWNTQKSVARFLSAVMK